MNLIDIHSVIQQYFPHKDSWEIVPISNGLINKTYKIINDKEIFILQKVNNDIFKNPESISHNIQVLSKHLKHNEFPYEIVTIIPTLDNRTTVNFKGQVWRMLTYVSNTKTIKTIENTSQAFEASKAFSALYFASSNLDIRQLKTSIPHFTDFSKRLEEYQHALKTVAPKRKKIAQQEILTCNEHLYLIHAYMAVEKIAPIRLLHADPKISNVLFDVNLKQVKAIIDLDTIMSGCILYDYGDMMRSFTNLFEEDVIDKELFSLDYYLAAKEGFLHHISSVLSLDEIENLALASKTVVLVQALRFLTDFLLGDSYYQTTYPLQNLNRCKNQLLLLDAIKKAL